MVCKYINPFTKRRCKHTAVSSGYCWGHCAGIDAGLSKGLEEKK